MSGIIASVIAVALVYVFSSNIILLMPEKKNSRFYSRSDGVHGSYQLLFLEATLLGTLVALIAWVISDHFG